MVKNQKDNRYSKPSPDDKNSYLKYTGIAFELTAYNILCVWGGYELDKYLGFKVPWILILSVIIAVVGSIYYLLIRLKG